MKILEPQNNALFLAYWRERMRPGPLFSAFLLISVIVLLIFANGLMNPEYVYHYDIHTGDHSQRTLLAWPKKVLLDLCYLQGTIILLFGSVSVYRKAARERSSKVIDFHRCSPTSRIDQALGMLFGGACLEWALFIALTLIEFFLLTFSYLPYGFFLQFIGALVICALFFHSLCILIAISQNHSTQSRVGVVGLLILLYFGITLFTASKLSFFYHMSWVPAFDQLTLAIKGERYHYTPYYFNQRKILYMFFGYKINSFFFQSMIQIPFIALFIHAIKRKISAIDHPPFSKGQTLLSIFYLLFLFSGSAISAIIHEENYNPFQNYHYSHIKEYLLSGFFYLTVTLGILGAFLITPDRSVYKKGLKRCLKLKVPRLRSGEDPSLNIKWLFTLCFIIFVNYILYALIFKISFLTGFLHLLILMSYPLSFGFLYQFFQLSQFQHKRLIFGTILLIFWIVLPIYSNIIKFKAKASLLYLLFTAPSPFFGGIIAMIQSITKVPHTDLKELISYTVISVVITLFSLGLVYYSRNQLKNKVLKEGI